MDNETGADISAKLEQAIAGDVETVESPSTETGTETYETTKEGKKGPNTVPYSRFKEVNDSKRELQEQYTELEASLRDQTSSLTRLTEMLDETKEDADLVREIRALANDPKMLPHIRALDNKIKGIEEEIEETGEVSTKTLDKTRQFLESKQSELAEEMADQRLEIITQRADAFAVKWLDQLPEEYTEQDREIIGKLWADAVDMDNLAQDPSQLHEVLRTTFQETIDYFGVPRGGLIDPADPDSYEVEIEEKPTLTPQEELQQIIQGKNYGGFKEVEVGGRKILQSEISDDEFAADMGRAMKVGRK